MAFHQEACDAECAAIARALETAARKLHTVGRLPIALWWCPAHKGAPGNEKTDEWTRLAAKEPDAHGVEFLGYGDWYGRRRLSPRSPRPLEALDHRDQVAGRQRRGRTSKPPTGSTGTGGRRDRSWIPSRPTRTSGSRRGSTSRRRAHCLTGQYPLGGQSDGPPPKCWWWPHKAQMREHLFRNCPQWKRQRT